MLSRGVRKGGSNMKVFLVWVDIYDEDQYDGIVVVADSKERALELVNERHYFDENQGPVFITEVNTSMEHVVLESLNG
jgi:hypothetical protein